MKWDVEASRRGEGKAFTFLNGTGCQVINEDSFSRNTCAGTVVKCRGELFTPGEGGSVATLTGKVERCLNP